MCGDLNALHFASGVVGRTFNSGQMHGIISRYLLFFNCVDRNIQRNFISLELREHIL